MSELRGIKPIVDKFLENNHIFALEFREGFLFGRVVRRRICQWKPYPLISATGADIDISASTHQPELRFRDPRNTQNTILYLDDSVNAGWPWFFHGAFGIKPQQINMYLRYPEADVLPGKFPNVDPIRPQAGDPLGFVNEINSPFERPTDFREVVLPPHLHIGAEYYNLDAERNHQPVIHILFALYWVQFFTPALHAQKIVDMALRRYEGARAAFLMAGFGDFPNDLGTQLVKDWKVQPLTLDEASNLPGGAR